MRQWARRFRGYLIVLPLALVVGFGFHGFNAYTGNNTLALRAVDVPKGEKAKLGPMTVQLVSLSVKQPQPPDDGSFNPDIPKRAVVVVAHFRGRIDDAKVAKDDKLFCEAKIENGDEWEWKSELLSEPYVPDNVAKGCDGTHYDAKSNKVEPEQGEWYDFYHGSYVPKDRAKDLRPTLSWFREHPRYLRFEN